MSIREANKKKMLDIIHNAGGKWLKCTSMVDDDEHFILGPNGKLILVLISDEGCDHFVQGGVRWVDLERDLSV